MSEITHVKEEDSIPFYPDHLTTEFKVVVGLVVIAFAIGIAGLISPVGIGDPADPMNTPAHVKPEWYFVALYQLLKFVPKTLGVMIPVVGVIFLALWPFFDSKPETTKKPTRVRFIVAVIGVIVIIAMTIWGEVS
ncbi:MAG: hypothetical protein PHS96_02680 [Anaerolineales bacterium]|nr:hypothetical protein [Anaerolineales bacterium]